MKKLACILCAISAVFAFSACGRDVPAEYTIDEQIRLIASKADEWKVLDDTEPLWGYAVTDLDQNGRLELISSEMHGDGFYSTTRIFEVNENCDALIECFDNFNASQPDFIAEEYRAFSANGIYHFIIEDMIKDENEFQTFRYITNSISLNGEAVECTVLRQRTDSYRYVDGGTEMTSAFYDGSGNSISEQEYNTLIDELYTGMQEHSVKIGWISSVHLSEYSNEQIKEMLVDSYGKFNIAGVR